MNLFQVPADKADEIKAVAKQLLAMGNDTFGDMLRRYNRQYDHLWHREGWTVADAQQCLDAMGPGVSASVFAQSGGMGVYINTVAPGTIPAARLSPPMAYTAEPIEISPQVGEEGDEDYQAAVTGYRIVLDSEGTYPGPIDS